jgi:hypothetical protein
VQALDGLVHLFAMLAEADAPPAGPEAASDASRPSGGVPDMDGVPVKACGGPAPASRASRGAVWPAGGSRPDFIAGNTSASADSVRPLSEPGRWIEAVYVYRRPPHVRQANPAGGCPPQFAYRVVSCDGETLAADAATPLAVLGGLILWLLRLAMAPASTLSGFRAWVLEECPVAPGRRAPRPAPAPAPARPGRGRRSDPRKATKTARFLDLVTERHGPLASIPLHRVAGISADLPPQADLNTGAARTALRKAVLAAQNGDTR